MTNISVTIYHYKYNYTLSSGAYITIRMNYTITPTKFYIILQIFRYGFSGSHYKLWFLSLNTQLSIVIVCWFNGLMVYKLKLSTIIIEWVVILWQYLHNQSLQVVFLPELNFEKKFHLRCLELKRYRYNHRVYRCLKLSKCFGTFTFNDINNQNVMELLCCTK